MKDSKSVDKIKITKVNEVYIKVDCEPSIAMEISDQFTFMIPSAKFHPAYKSKFWDGKIRLFNVNTKLLYRGLLDNLISFLESRNYIVDLQKSLYTQVEITSTEILEFIEKLNTTFIPRDYQLEAFAHAIMNERSLLLSPTASGKSFIIYLIMRYYDVRTLIIVPTTSLVHQLSSDFSEYGFDSDRNIHRITGGVDKRSDKRVTISTWQSLYKLPKDYFEQFDMVIGDEAHLFQAKSLTKIMEKTINTKYKFGFTGTLDGSLTNQMVLEGLFGPTHKVVSTSELIEKKHLADFKIKCIILEYSDEERKNAKSFSYHDEVDFLVRNSRRNSFLCNLCTNLEGNTLVLFQFVEKHGRLLYQLMRDKNDDRELMFVFGGTEAEDREQVRKITEQSKNAIIVASYGTFSTGINIRNLHNVVFSSPTKSRIRTLQSIGRGLRKSDTKTSAILYDIADDLRWKSHTNFTLKHLMERINIYNSENFDYKMYNYKV